MATTEQQHPWQLAIVERLGEYTDNENYTHAVVHIGADTGDAVLLHRANGQDEAADLADDAVGRVDGGEVKIVPFDLLYEQYVEIKDAVEADAEVAQVEADPFEAEVSPDDSDDMPLTVPDPAGKKLFDPSQFEAPDLRIDDIDGEHIQKIAAKFSGGIWLDRSNPEHVALIRDLHLGQTVTLQIEATVGPPVPSSSTNREGDLDVLSLSRTFKVTELYKLKPEELK